MRLGNKFYSQYKLLEKVQIGRVSSRRDIYMEVVLSEVDESLSAGNILLRS
jgi:hypothetical protein